MEINCLACGSAITINRNQLSRKYCDPCRYQRKLEQRRNDARKSHRREIANRKPVTRFCDRCTVKLPPDARLHRKYCDPCGIITQRERGKAWNAAKRGMVPKAIDRPITLFKEDFGDASTTKIGAISELFVATHLMRRGFVISKPLSDGTEYDLVAEKAGSLFRVEVRTGYYRKGNIYPIAGNYKHKKFDILAVVCNGEIRYIKNCK